MVKKSKLLLALDAQKGRDYEAEKKKKQVKAAERRKRKRSNEQEHDDKENQTNAGMVEPDDKAINDDDDVFEAFGSEDEEEEIIPQPQEELDDSPSEPEDDSDVPLSDLEAEDREDIVPHQRMTINNSAALTASRKRISLVSDRAKHPFHYHNSLVSADKPAPELIPDPNDDETRELMFYKIARDATVTARKLLKQEKIPFSRPPDYFAEMVKSDEHMGKVKKKLYDEAASKKAAQEARKLRDAKKFGKQVQLAKEQERAKEKRDTLNKIKDLKKKRKGMDTGRVNEGDDLFQDIDVDENSAKERPRSDRRPNGQSNTKRQKKDSKFGFGGRKRHSKSGTAESSADMRGFSAKKMKGKPSSSARRPGKSRRASSRT